MTKTIAIYHNDSDYADVLLKKFQAVLPNHRLTTWGKDLPADYLVAWQPHEKLFVTPRLQVVFALGAGIDAFVAAELPEHLRLVRLEEAGMGKQMLEMALYAILHYSRDMVVLNQAQRQRQWLPLATPKKLPFSAKIGVMGLGQLGGFIAHALAKMGYPVSGYSRRQKQLPHVACFSEHQLDDFLANSEVLINLLPLTPQTRHILNRDLFAKLPKGAYLVNLARGKHLLEDDLIPTLDSGQLCGALLDVFQQEPLPPQHPFWDDERIIITPHLAAITLQDDAVEQISNNILAFEKGQTMSGIVDRQRGY